MARRKHSWIRVLWLAVVAPLVLQASPASSFAGVTTMANPLATLSSCRSTSSPPPVIVVVAFSQKVFMPQPKYASTAASSMEPENSNSDHNDNDNERAALRSRLRQLTGFSVTAFRASMRALTGMSLTAIYVATLAATGAWIRQITKFVLSLFPPPVRYFFQPFLVLYFAPLFILRNLTGPTRKRALQAHGHVLDGWKAAVEKAEDTVSYWPIHYDEQGHKFESDGTLDVKDGIEESVNVAMDTAMDEEVPPLKK